jgi:hypothetical protein
MKKIILLIALMLPMFAQGQASVTLLTMPHIQFFDANGIPLSSGCIFTYVSGTVTNQATYTDFSGAFQNSNPVILDSGGYANIWLDQTKTYRIKAVSSGGSNCSTGATQWTVDGISGTLPKIFSSDGTCAGTGIGFLAETTTGFIRPASGTIDFCAAGSDVLKVTSSAITPTTAGGMTAGSQARPFSSLYIGAAGTNNAQLTGTFTAARVFTFPDSNDSFMLLTTAQSPTNKTFKVDTNTFVDPTDTTKTLKFSLSGLTAGKTLTLAGINTVNQTITFPDATDTVVTLAASQTLTTKTLTSPTITNPTVNTGVAQGSGHKHQRFGTICTTGAAAGNACVTTATWTTPFADSNYTVVCVGVGRVNNPVLQITSVAAATFVIDIYTTQNLASSYTSVHCTADHD